MLRRCAHKIMEPDRSRDYPYGMPLGMNPANVYSEDRDECLVVMNPGLLEAYDGPYWACGHGADDLIGDILEKLDIGNLVTSGVVEKEKNYDAESDDTLEFTVPIRAEGMGADAMVPNMVFMLPWRDTEEKLWVRTMINYGIMVQGRIVGNLWWRHQKIVNLREYSAEEVMEAGPAVPITTVVFPDEVWHPNRFTIRFRHTDQVVRSMLGWAGPDVVEEPEARNRNFSMSSQTR